MNNPDSTNLRDVVKQYVELAHDPDLERKRELWRRYHGFEDGPVPIVVAAAGYFVWMKEGGRGGAI